LIIGDDKGHKKYRKKLEKKITINHLENRVCIEKNTDDMPATYMFADIVISASTRPEAFGRVSVEAQAMKKSIIATALGGSLETIIDGKTGWLVSPKDPKHLAEKIDMVLSMKKGDREKIAENAYKNVHENFSTKKMCDTTLEIYRKLAKK
jgi:glycosyltransferase involved in cell wall biosynthesis